jgi:hypothetical protein
MRGEEGRGKERRREKKREEEKRREKKRRETYNIVVHELERRRSRSSEEGRRRREGGIHASAPGSGRLGLLVESERTNHSIHIHHYYYYYYYYLLLLSQTRNYSLCLSEVW